MEELKSTEALDREILEDARKKAERLLRNADQAADAASLAWAKKAETDIAELERKHGQRVAECRKETLARLPLDKRRERAQRAERLLLRAVIDYLRKQPRNRLLSLVAKELSERVGALPGSALIVTASGFSPGEAETLLSAALPAGSWTFAASNPATPSHPATPSSSFASGLNLPSLIVHGGRVLIRASVQSAAEELLREKREELAVALLGEGAAND